MLEKIRKPGRTKSLFAYIIFGLICLVFVFLGVPIDSISGGQGFAAIVNKEIISIAEFKQALRNIQKQNGSVNPTDDQRQREEQRMILDQLINSQLIFQSALQSGLSVSNQELRDQITSFPAFQEDGKFKNALYRSYLNYTRATSKSFENQIKQMILSSRIQKLFNQVFILSDLEFQKNQELENIQFELKYVSISLSQNQSSEETLKWQNLLTSYDQLEKELKSQNLKWIQVPPLSLGKWSSVLPENINEDELFENVLEKIPQKGLIPQLMVNDQKINIFYVENFKITPTVLTKTSPEFDIFSLTLSNTAFNSWLKLLRENSRIRINAQFI